MFHFLCRCELFLYDKIGSDISRTCWTSGGRYPAILYLFPIKYTYHNLQCLIVELSTVAVIPALVVVSEASKTFPETMQLILGLSVTLCSFTLTLEWWCCPIVLSNTWLVCSHLRHGRRLNGYILFQDCSETSYEYMKPAYTSSIKDQRAADMGYRSSDMNRPHECSIIDQQSQYGDQQS